MDLETRERRGRMHARTNRRRLLAAAVLALLFHLAAVPVAVLVLVTGPRRGARPEPKVSFVEVPASSWDAARRIASPGAKPAPDPRAAPKPAARAEERKEPEVPAPAGPTVVVPPGNDQVDPDARFSAETNNRVERESVARDRRPSDVTMPKTTTTRERADARPPPGEGRPGELSIGPGGEGRDAKRGASGSALEIPSVERRDQVALPEDASGAGRIRNRAASEELAGNSDRFRIRVGEGEADDEEAGAGSPAGGGAAIRLFPEPGELDRIAGAAAPDHVEGVEEGDGTYLNTREWKYASFFVRLKKSVARTWKPIEAVRKRDPTGEIYAWKDRHTLLSVTLRADGALEDVWIEQSSGVEFLDREAIAAFERAQPFPNPPPGLQDGTGRIRFSFGFYLETGRAGFRLFR